jgi:hypothetical protein
VAGFIITQKNALHLAAEFGHTACVRVLLEAGADTSATDSVRYFSSHRSQYVVFACVFDVIDVCY